MPEWLVRLNGEKSDLVYLCTLRSSEWSVKEENGNYYLKCKSFDQKTDGRSVFDCTTQILDVMNGIMKLEYPNMQPIKAVQVIQTRNDGKHTQVVLPAFIPSGERIFPPKVFLADDSKCLQGQNIMESRIDIAEQDKLVSRALTLYGALEHNWKNLYMVLEVIEQDVGGENELIKKPWAIGYDIKLFKRTANNFIVIGREARHGHDKDKPPKNPINLSEAQALIRNILSKWIHSKSCSTNGPH